MTKKVIETTNGWYMENEKEKVELEDIIGLVETDEQTDSVEVIKEYYNSKSINKRYNAMFNKYCGLVVADMSTNPRICSARRISDMEIVDELNSLSDENEQLKTVLKNTSDQRNEFHRAARENANRVGKLEKENEQLKRQLDFCRRVIEENQMVNEIKAYKRER